MALDRLQRCNPWALGLLGKYYHGIREHKIHDPVQNNYIFGTIVKEDPDARLLNVPERKRILP